MAQGVAIKRVAEKGPFYLVKNRVLEMGMFLQRYRRRRIVGPRFRHYYSPNETERREWPNRN